jgi:hypothetical protein
MRDRRPAEVEHTSFVGRAADAGDGVAEGDQEHSRKLPDDVLVIRQFPGRGLDYSL